MKEIESTTFLLKRSLGSPKDHFLKWQRILLFLFIYVNYTYWPHFGLNILLNIAHGSGARKVYQH